MSAANPSRPHLLHRRTLVPALLLLAGLGVSTPGWVSAAELPELGLEELLAANVTGASRRPQALHQVAAAAFVLTREDIRRSGATSIPEALRLVPGVQVAKISSSMWAVSVRGFNSRYANKLQVLLDGRSLYSPLFAGVFWEADDTLIEDIERIEVIRGPGAAMWGANAVNGVVNIVTRRARDTQGTLVVAAAGTEGEEMAVRHGMGSGSGHLRFWARGLSADTSVDATGVDGADTWRGGRAGFRGDWPLGADDRLTVSGGAQRSEVGDRWLEPDLTAPSGMAAVVHRQVNHGSHLLARHESILAGGSETALQAWIEHGSVYIDQTLTEERDTADVDFQHRLQLGDTHDFMYGFEYRYSRDSIESGGTIRFDPLARSYRLASGFVHDEVTLIPETLKLAAGLRLEHNTATGTEPQPSLRALWTPSRQQSVWASVARAARVPSRAERDSTVDVNVIPAAPPAQPPILVRSVPPAGHELQAEDLVATEAGYRHSIADLGSIDLTVFSNRYRNLRSGSFGSLALEFSPVLHLVQSSPVANGVSARSRGAELAVDWQATSWWRLYPSVTYLHLETWAETPSDPVAVESAKAIAGTSPEWQAVLRSSMNLNADHQFDLQVRYVGRLKGSPAAGNPGVPSYTAVDVRYGWRLRRNLEFSLVGRNLFDRQHPEFIPDGRPSQALEIERAYLAKVTWQM